MGENIGPIGRRGKSQPTALIRLVLTNAEVATTVPCDSPRRAQPLFRLTSGRYSARCQVGVGESVRLDCSAQMTVLGAERAIWKSLQDSGANVYRMGTVRGVTWMEVWIDGHVARFDSEWTADSTATTIAAALLQQIEARRPLDARPPRIVTGRRTS